MCYYPFFRTDLPDDDYTTLVPKSKTTNINLRDQSKVSITTENGHNDSKSSIKERTNKNGNDTTKRNSKGSINLAKHPRSAPSSPALYHGIKQRSNHKQTSMDPIENKRKHHSRGHSSLSINAPTNSLLSGVLEVRLKFDSKNSRMWIFVLKATIEMTQYSFKPTFVQVHLTVLPNKRNRFRTRVKPIDNAMFAEEFFCKVSPETIETQGIRFRLYMCERFKREKLLAEAKVMFASINLDEDMCTFVQFERADSHQDSSDVGLQSQTSSNSHSRENSVVRSTDGVANQTLPEIQVGLAYDKVHSILTLEIGKGMNFGTKSQSRPPDTFVQIMFRNLDGEKMITNRTGTRFAQHHPVFAERYPIHIQENFLSQITLVITVINKRAIDKHVRDLGSICFGHDASGSAQVAHWNSMLNAQGETITRWHSLLEK